LDDIISVSMDKERQQQLEYDIVTLQRCLRVIYPDSDVFDNGQYANFTQRLVIRFQESNGVKADGVVDHNTWLLIRGRLYLC
jgi:peptidoglycan hydrolase-like protein with peptidoglycan-binding domain